MNETEKTPGFYEELEQLIEKHDIQALIIGGLANGNQIILNKGTLSNQSYLLKLLELNLNEGFLDVIANRNSESVPH